METSETIKGIATALAKAQATMHGATRDRKNPAFKSDYATLSSVIEAARGPLTENGIAFIQSPGAMEDGGVPVTTTFVHGETGEWFRSRVVMPVRDRNNPQAVGSAITYGCRYSLMAMLGLPPVDDDGNAAAQGNGRSEPVRREPPKAEKPREPTDAEKAAAAEIEEAFDACETEEELEAAREANVQPLGMLPDALKARLRKVYGMKREILRNFAADEQEPQREAAE